jgi:hypothetical protein
MLTDLWIISQVVLEKNWKNVPSHDGKGGIGDGRDG